MKVAAIYARVSSKRQEQEGTIESQVASLLAYAEANGYAVPPEHRYLDEGVSGAALIRPALERLRDAVYIRAFEVLLVLDIDRLARDLGLQVLLLDEFQRGGVEVRFLNSPSRGDTPTDELLFTITGAFAQYERQKIVARMRRGWLHKVRQGERVPQPAPYGYRYVPVHEGQPSRWEVVEREAEVVRQIYRWYTEEVGIPFYQIAQRLNAAQTPAPQGGRWGHSSVRRILRNRSYTGEGLYNRRAKDPGSIGAPKLIGRGRTRHPRLRPRPQEDWIAFTVPAIIAPEQWEAAQAIMTQNQQLARRNSKRTYLLSGLMVCDVCKRTMHGVTYQERSYYRCAHGGKRRAEGVPRHSMVVPCQEAEAAVWNALRQLLQQPERIVEAWERYKATEDQGEITRLRKRMTQLKAQRERLLDAYQEGLISRQELAKRQNPLLRALEKTEVRLREVQSIQATEISLEAFTQQIQQALAATDFDLQRSVIRLLIERIIVKDDALVIEHLVPTSDISKLRPQRQVTKPQRKIPGFRQEKSAETPSSLLFSLPPLLIPAFFQESQ